MWAKNNAATISAAEQQELGMSTASGRCRIDRMNPQLVGNPLQAFNVKYQFMRGNIMRHEEKKRTKVRQGSRGAGREFFDSLN